MLHTGYGHLVTIVSTPSTAPAASIIASELASAVAAISTGLVIRTASLMMSTVTAKSRTILGALLAVHLMIKVAWVSPETLLVLLRLWWRKAGLTWLTWHAVHGGTWAARLTKRRILSAGTLDVPVRLQGLIATSLLTAVLLMKRLALTRVSRLRAAEYIWHTTKSATARRMLLVFGWLSRSRATVTSNTASTKSTISSGHRMLTKPTYVGRGRRLLVGRLRRHSIPLMRLSIHATLASKRSTIALVAIAKLTTICKIRIFITSGVVVQATITPMRIRTYLVQVRSIVGARVIGMSIRVASGTSTLPLMLLWHVLRLLDLVVLLLTGYGRVWCGVAACLRFGSLSIT